jgi:oligopeptide/dipeptide ABC transporter ATP-binding protein
MTNQAISSDKPALEVQGLGVAFHTERGEINPVGGVSFTLYPGQTLALVGESGCGKSVTALSVMRLIPSPPGRVTGGRVMLNGRDLLAISEKEMQAVRGKEIAMIFQEPMTSLNPVFTIGEQIVEAVRLHQHVGSRQAYEIAEQSLRDVGIADPGRRIFEYPHQMSGGMRQRVMIAMALSCQPRVLIADEPTTALDVTIQAQILELLRDLQRKRQMSILLITHDLGVVAENADVVAVMYASRIVEYASADALFRNPRHPYTRGLFRALPRLSERVDRLITIPGQVPNPSRFPGGCKFHPRCDTTQEVASAEPRQAVPVLTESGPVKVMPSCRDKEPELREVERGHWAACHFAPGYVEARATSPDLAVRRDTSDSAADSALGVMP